MAPLPNPLGQFPRPIEKVKRGEIVWAADIVLPSLAGAEENAVRIAHHGLGRLHIEAFGMQGDFAGDGDAALVGAEIIGTGLKTQRRCEPAKLR